MKTDPISESKYLKNMFAFVGLDPNKIGDDPKIIEQEMWTKAEKLEFFVQMTMDLIEEGYSKDHAQKAVIVFDMNLGFRTSD